MPPRPRRVLVRASHRLLRQLGHPAALLVAIALSVATSLPASALDAGVPAPTPPTSPARTPIETPASTLAKRPASRIGSEPGSRTLKGAVVDPLGRAWVRTDIDGNGAIGIRTGSDDGGTAYRAAFVAGSGWWLPNGEVTDRVGHTSAIDGEPYRVQPPVSTAAANPEPTVERWSGRYNLYREGAFVTQKTFRWCVAASVQMMVNLVRNHTDRTRATQARMIAYAQRWDNGPYGEDGGTDVTGWITALRHFGAGKYRAVGSTTAAGALRIAATAMRQTGRPAGILVMDGRHAWVLHGFESKTDPRLDSRAWISAVRVSGPLYPLQRKGGYDPRPNTRLSARTLGRFFLPSSVGTLAGRYVVIIPTH
ncbi:MAG TPA: hypothetical protein VFW02_01825 [Candidatus Limnocylindrales bacterium]|nr:hypothetical protein [Candidatus Limnocylindrales bacterium]